jgi:hypothetical protein
MWSNAETDPRTSRVKPLAKRAFAEYDAPHYPGALLPRQRALDKDFAMRTMDRGGSMV